MRYYHELFENNKKWAENIRKEDPTYFERRSASQEPHFLFIGCCDSRVPTELLTAAKPGEIFTHRNIANQVHPSDLNLLSVLEYAVEVLDVNHVIVCGHYNCGGVKGAMGPSGHGVVDHWLHVLRDVNRWHEDELSRLDPDARFRRLVELNVVEQVFQLTRTPIIHRAWARGKRPILSGLVYDINDGLLREMVAGIDCEEKARDLREAVTGPSSAKKKLTVRQ